jgi:hypothetical protein
MTKASLSRRNFVSAAITTFASIGILQTIHAKH